MEKPVVINPSHLRDIILGKAKPANDAEAMQASSALMWKQAFEIAMRPLAQEEEDPISSPQKQAVHDAQAQWMGVEAAIAFGKSLSSQLEHKGASSKVTSSVSSDDGVVLTHADPAGFKMPKH